MKGCRPRITPLIAAAVIAAFALAVAGGACRAQDDSHGAPRHIAW